MSIACDGRALLGPLTGVGTWTTEVMGGLAVRGESVLLASPRPLAPPTRLKHERITLLPPPRVTIPGTLWLHTRLPHDLRRSQARVFVAALGILPRRCPIPGVVVLHDLTPRSHPHRHTLRNRFCFNAYLEESLDTAAAVVCVSRATETEALRSFPWLRSRLQLIPNGVDEFFSPAHAGTEGEALRRRFAGGRPYILHLGTLEPRKGLTDLIAAWELLHELVGEPPDLVLAGHPGWSTAPILRRVADSPFRERIHLPGYVSRSDARELLRHTSCFVLASEVEGYGLPLAEALSCGAVAVASDIPSLREVAAGACLHAAPKNPSALAHAIAGALQPEGRRELRERALARAEELRWGPVVEAWRDLLGAVVSGS